LETKSLPLRSPRALRDDLLEFFSRRGAELAKLLLVKLSLYFQDFHIKLNILNNENQSNRNLAFFAPLREKI